MGAWEQGTLHGCEIMRSHEGGKDWPMQSCLESSKASQESFMVYTTASTLSTNSLQWSLELPPWREGGGMVTRVAALEGGRRDGHQSCRLGGREAGCRCHLVRLLT